MCWSPTAATSVLHRTLPAASTGTASAADVWGGERAWLVPVDSPYDQSYATHWNTNGATSGTARFARATVQQRILDLLGIDLSGVDPNSWFKILSANQYGWVSQMQIGPDGGPQPPPAAAAGSARRCWPARAWTAAACAASASPSATMPPPIASSLTSTATATASA